MLIREELLFQLETWVLSADHPAAAASLPSPVGCLQTTGWESESHAFPFLTNLDFTPVSLPRACSYHRHCPRAHVISGFFLSAMPVNPALPSLRSPGSPTGLHHSRDRWHSWTLPALKLSAFLSFVQWFCVKLICKRVLSLKFEKCCSLVIYHIICRSMKYYCLYFCLMYAFSHKLLWKILEISLPVSQSGILGSVMFFTSDALGPEPKHLIPLCFCFFIWKVTL